MRIKKSNRPVKTIQIPYKYEPRPYQKPLMNAIENGYKRGISIWHRRSGKDKTYINMMIREAMIKVAPYYYCFPTYAQGKKILWDGMDRDGFKFMDHIPREIIDGTPNNTEMKVKFTNGSIFQIIGTDNFDSIVGPNPYGLVFSEYSLQDPRAWDYYRPILAENEGWAFFNYTPRGHNHAYNLYKMAKDNPLWFTELLTVDDTHAITLEAIDDERKAGMSEDLIRQEFYCSFESSVVGAYYANELRMLDANKRICDVPVEPNIPINSYWDIGMDDSTSIWLGQTIGGIPKFVGYYSNSGQALSHYVDWLKEWKTKRMLVLGVAVLPHDGNNRNLQTNMTNKEFLENNGIESTVVTRPKNKMETLEVVRRFLIRCWFDNEGTEKGLQSLRNYRTEYNEENGVYALRPVHDWASHGADALQTCAIYHQNYKEPVTNAKIYIPPACIPVMNDLEHAGQGWMR